MVAHVYDHMQAIVIILELLSLEIYKYHLCQFASSIKFYYVSLQTCYGLQFGNLFTIGTYELRDGNEDAHVIL